MRFATSFFGRAFRRRIAKHPIQDRACFAVRFNTKGEPQMIVSLDELTERLFRTGDAPWLARDVAEKALQRLDWLDAGSHLHDIAAPNGLRFQKYHGQRDCYAVHVKDKWWIRFRWVHPNCSEVTLFQKR
jgi:plasmid maintenance system killer protein